MNEFENDFGDSIAIEEARETLIKNPVDHKKALEECKKKRDEKVIQFVFICDSVINQIHDWCALSFLAISWLMQDSIDLRLSNLLIFYFFAW